MTTLTRHFLVRDGKQYGPFDARQLFAYEADNRVAPTDILRSESDGHETTWSALRPQLIVDTPLAPPTAPPTTRPAIDPDAEAAQSRNRALEVAIPVNVAPAALVAGYLGLASLIMPLVGPVAIVLGIYALRTMKSHQAGTFRAIVGIALGALGTVLGVVVVIALMLA